MLEIEKGIKIMQGADGEILDTNDLIAVLNTRKMRMKVLRVGCPCARVTCRIVLSITSFTALSKSSEGLHYKPNFSKLAAAGLFFNSNALHNGCWL